MSPDLRQMYVDHYRAMTTPALWDEAQALFGDHSVSAELSTRKFRLVVIELTRRGLVFEPEAFTAKYPETREASRVREDEEVA